MTTRSLPRTHGTRRPTRVTMCVIFGVLAALLGGALVSAAAPPSSVAEPANAEARAQLLALADARRFEPETLAKLAADPDDGIRAATAFGSWTSTRSFKQYQARVRYIAPVST